MNQVDYQRKLNIYFNLSFGEILCRQSHLNDGGVIVIEVNGVGSSDKELFYYREDTPLYVSEKVLNELSVFGLPEVQMGVYLVSWVNQRLNMNFPTHEIIIKDPYINNKIEETLIYEKYYK